MERGLPRAPKVTVSGEGSIPASFGGGEARGHLREDILTVGYGHGHFDSTETGVKYRMVCIHAWQRARRRP